jgi:CopG family transcriptional regulator / antitoxin EndoAI
MSKRINIMLPEKTLAVLDRVAPRGDRSRFVSAAVLHYVETKGKQSLRQQLKAGYLANADENLRVAAEWFPLEEEAWQKSRTGHGVKNKR